MAEPSDEELVQAHVEGDPAAFERLVRRHEGRVYSVCLRMLGRQEDARDAAQDTFLQVLRKVSQFRGDAAFGTWLHRIAVNACYDMLRKRARQPMLRLVDEEAGPERDLGPPAPDHADAVVGGIDVRQALLEVPVEFRVALVLIEIQDLSYEEAAAVLDVPVGTVKSRVHRGRLALARAMGATGEPDTDPDPSERHP